MNDSTEASCWMVSARKKMMAAEASMDIAISLLASSPPKVKEAIEELRLGRADLEMDTPTPISQPHLDAILKADRIVSRLTWEPSTRRRPGDPG